MKQSQTIHNNSVNLLSFIKWFGKSTSRSEETGYTRASTNKAVVQMVKCLEEGKAYENTHFSRTFSMIHSNGNLRSSQPSLFCQTWKLEPNLQLSIILGNKHCPVVYWTGAEGNRQIFWTFLQHTWCYFIWSTGLGSVQLIQKLPTIVDERVNYVT